MPQTTATIPLGTKTTKATRTRRRISPKNTPLTKEQAALGYTTSLRMVLFTKGFSEKTLAWLIENNVPADIAAELKRASGSKADLPSGFCQALSNHSPPIATLPLYVRTARVLPQKSFSAFCEFLARLVDDAATGLPAKQVKSVAARERLHTEIATLTTSWLALQTNPQTTLNTLAQTTTAVNLLRAAAIAFPKEKARLITTLEFIQSIPVDADEYNKALRLPLTKTDTELCLALIHSQQSRDLYKQALAIAASKKRIAQRLPKAVRVQRATQKAAASTWLKRFNTMSSLPKDPATFLLAELSTYDRSFEDLVELSTILTAG